VLGAGRLYPLILYLCTMLFLNLLFNPTTEKLPRDLINLFSYNKSQRDALFHRFILVKNSAYFGQICYPPSGVPTLYTQQLVFVMLVMLTASGHGVETPDDGQ